MEQQPVDPEKKSAVRIRLIMWAVISVLIFLAPQLAIIGKYGWVLFITIPMSVGIVSSLIASFNKRHSVGTLIGYAFIPAGVLALAFMILAREGFICVLMAIPVIIIPLILGAVIGYAIQDYYWSKYVGIILVFFLNTGAYVADLPDPEFDVITVEDRIVIAASPEKVWQQLSQPFEFGSAENFFLDHGVSFPKAMELRSENNCNSLYCEYSNGVMTATVDSLVPQQLLRFSFHEPPVSMVETSFYSEVEPNHIRGRIMIDYGSFRIVPHGENETELIATTQYRNNIGPRFYWRWWSEYLMHELHGHVLEKVRSKAEE